MYVIEKRGRLSNESSIFAKLFWNKIVIIMSNTIPVKIGDYMKL